MWERWLLPRQRSPETVSRQYHKNANDQSRCSLFAWWLAEYFQRGKHSSGDLETYVSLQPECCTTIERADLRMLNPLALLYSQVTQQLFSEFVRQIIRWFTSSRTREHPETMALLDAILEGLVDEDRGALR